MWSSLTSIEPDIGLAHYILEQPAVLVAGIVGALVLGLLAWLLARTRGWHRVATVLAAASLAFALAVTLARPGAQQQVGGNALYLCVNSPFSFSLHGGEQLLNFAMLMPLAFFATVATKRPVAIVVSCTLLSAAIEVTQALTALGVCSRQDFVTNSMGAIVAAAAACALVVLPRSIADRKARSGSPASPR